MTPARLTELGCPQCQKAMWILDSDYRGTDGVMIPYSERSYACPSCSHRGAGWTLLQQSPPEFLLQPHDLYPMSKADFEQWLGVLRRHFPDHPRLRDREFVRRTPEEAIRILEGYGGSDGRFPPAFQKAVAEIRKKFGLGQG